MSYVNLAFDPPRLVIEKPAHGDTISVPGMVQFVVTAGKRTPYDLEGPGNFKIIKNISIFAENIETKERECLGVLQHVIPKDNYQYREYRGILYVPRKLTGKFLFFARPIFDGEDSPAEDEYWKSEGENDRN